VLTGGAWRTVAGAAPTPRGGHAMAYDLARQRIVLYGGFTNEAPRLADTWEWDGADWTCVAGCGR
jgi:hypothetical protein